MIVLAHTVEQTERETRGRREKTQRGTHTKNYFQQIEKKKCKTNEIYRGHEHRHPVIYI